MSSVKAGTNSRLSGKRGRQKGFLYLVSRVRIKKNQHRTFTIITIER